MSEKTSLEQRMVAMATASAEAALRHQKIAADSLAEMRRTSADLSIAAAALPRTVALQTAALAESSIDTAVAGAVQTMLKDFHGANEAAQNAQEAYERATRQVWLRVLAPAFAVLVAFVACVVHFVPTLDEVRIREARIVELENKIDYLQLVKQADLSRCDQKGAIRLCAKLDAKDGKSYQGYRIIAKAE